MENAVVSKSKQVVKCNSSLGQKHLYKIIKDSGRETGTPKWRCIFCNHIVKSS